MYLYPQLFHSSRKKNEDEEDEITLDNSQDEKEVDESAKGFIKLNKQKKEITKTELLDLIESIKEKLANHEGLNNDLFLRDFRMLVNGMFQSEGHIGGSFTSKKSSNIYPKVSLSQNASDSSIEFLVMLWLIFDKKLTFGISRNYPSRFFHITLIGSG